MSTLKEISAQLKESNEHQQVTAENVVSLAKSFEGYFQMEKANKLDALESARETGNAVGGGTAALAGASAGGRGGELGGGGKGLLSKLSGGLLGGLAAGLSALGAVSVIAGKGIAVIGLLLATIGGVTWLFGKSGQAVGEAFTKIADGLKALDAYGKDADPVALENAGGALAAFFGKLSDGFLDNLGGGIITFLTGDLPKIANGLNSLNNIEIDKNRIKEAGEALKLFQNEVGETSLWGTLKNVVGSNLNDLEGLASGISAVNAAEYENLAKVGEGLTAVAPGLSALAGTGFGANFISDEAFTDLATQVSSINATLGTDEQVEGSKKAALVLDQLSPALARFGEAAPGWGDTLKGILQGDDSPINSLVRVSEAADGIGVAASNVDILTVSLAKLQKLGDFGGGFAKGTQGLRNFAEQLMESVPVIEMAIGGGKIESGAWYNPFSEDKVIKGLGSDDLPYDKAINRLKELRSAMGGSLQNAQQDMNEAQALSIPLQGSSIVSDNSTNVNNSSSTGIVNGIPSAGDWMDDMLGPYGVPR